MNIKDTDTIIVASPLTIKATEYVNNNQNGYYCWIESMSKILIVPYIDFGYKKFSSKPPSGYQKDIKVALNYSFSIPLRSNVYEFPASLVDDNFDLNEIVCGELFKIGLELKKIIKKSPKIYSEFNTSSQTTTIIYVQAINNNCKCLYDKDQIDQLLKQDVQMCDKTWLILNNFLKESYYG